MTNTVPLCGGQSLARRLSSVAVLLACCILPVAGAYAESERAPMVTVREDGGVYEISARFAVPEVPSVAMAVLTDYEAIPRILPDIRTSLVLERSAGRTLVEQEVVSRMMFFTKRLHLLLEIQEDERSIAFRDACGRSFELYEGVWRVWVEDGATQILYELSARPAFDVPSFVLTRVLNRDAKRMIARLSAEMRARALKGPASRSTRTQLPPSDSALP